MSDIFQIMSDIFFTASNRTPRDTDKNRKAGHAGPHKTAPPGKTTNIPPPPKLRRKQARHKLNDMGTTYTPTQAIANRRRHIMLAVFCIIAFFANNTALRPDIMETRNLQTAREMVEGDHWLVPMMNGNYRLEKPPLPTWIAAVVDAVSPDNLATQRAMSGLAGCMMVVFFYLLGKRVTRRDDYAFIASLMLITCYNIILMARTATWDIYCHAFMLGGIYYLTRGLYEERRIWRHMLLAGTFMGLSFMSKGPVSFYALLLPWIIAVVLFRRPTMRGRIAPLMAMIAVCLVLSSWWYVYILITHSEAANYVINKESDSWRNRSVRPWYYYWRFFTETGVWTPLMFIALAVPFWRRKLAASKHNYTFAMAWVLAALVLLSLMPEKKMRYLLPMMIPCCFAMAYLIIYWNDKRGKPTARNVVLVVAAVFAAAELFAMPFIARQFYNPDYNSISQTYGDPRLKDVPFYYNKANPLRIEVVYASHRIIRPLEFSSPHIADTLTAKLPCALVTRETADKELPAEVFNRFDTVYIGKFNDSNRSRFANYGKDASFIYNVTLLKPKKNDRQQDR